MTQPLRLATGTELLGAWQGSAYASQPCLIKRRDGQVLRVSQLIYAVAAALSESEDLHIVFPAEEGAESADLHELAARVASRSSRDVDASNVAFLLQTKLAPLGVLDWGQAPQQLPRPQAVLALRLRFKVVPERLHRRVTSTLTFLFWPPLVVTALLALAGGDIWLAVARGHSAFVATGAVLDHPALILAVTAMTVFAAMIHETGHAAGTRAGGATPGVMGAGIYLAWPVFYTDISDSYRLSRGGRLRADLGGVYFNVLTLLAAIAAYGATRWSPLLVFVAVTHLEVLTQFLPFVRLDGYWVVSDLVGVPNLFAYLGPVVARLTRAETPASRARLAEIRPWARRVISGWVAATTVVLGVELLIVGWLGPRLVTQAVEAMIGRARLLGLAVSAGRPVIAVVDLFDLVFLAVPAAGLLYMGALLTGRAVGAVRRWRRQHPARAVSLTGALLALAALQILTVVRGLLPSPPASPGYPGQPLALGRPPSMAVPP
ncbi:hypothetical protein GHK86_04555, partial [Acidimicrobiaceae bacterium USS-CC1]|nr:hypothetical protein [Acidiferrimicrobium australe]